MTNFLRIAILSIYFLFFIAKINAQSADILFQSWYWNYPNYTTGEGYFMEHLDAIGDNLKEAGFTYVWLPPLAKGTGGSFSMGYDVKDYYDIGEFGYNKWGSKAHYNSLKTHYNAIGLNIVSDMIYNHRDGGNWENNTAVEGWIEHMTYTKIANGDQPYPSDRFRCYFAIGGDSGNGAGTYYFKIHSASQHPNFFNKPYTFIAYTNTVAANYVATALIESTTNNGGGDCGELNDIATLGIRMNASIDDSGCGTDEFALTLSETDFNDLGDTLWFSLYNTGSGGLADVSDHFVYGLWNGALGSDIQTQIQYQTATDFTNLPSGMGAMNYLNFKPNGNPTQLSGDLDAMLFYYDIDQTIPSSQATLQAWTKWMWQTNGVKGFRMDAVKHFPAWFVGDMMDYLHDNSINPGMVVGESFDYSSDVLKGWVDDVTYNMNDDTKASIHVRIFDFALRNELEKACDAFGYDVRNIFNSGVVDGAGGSGFNVVTFINNHDFRDGDQPISTNPELVYAYILTNNKIGVPCVFYSDYFAPKNLQYQINGLIQVQKKYIYGATYVDYLNRFGSSYTAEYESGASATSLIYQLRYAESGKEVLVAINFSGNTLKVNQTINTASIFVGDTLTDIFSQTPTAFQIVHADNKMYMEVPARSYAVWIQGDLTNALIDISTPLSMNTILNTKPLKVYPNPTASQLTIELPAEIDDHSMLEISDLNGAIYLQETTAQLLRNNKIIIALTHYIPGTYTVKITSKNEVYTSNFIIAK